MTSIQPAPSQHPISREDKIITTPWHMWLNKLRERLSVILDGSGTANYITKWSDSDTLTDSVFTEEQLRSRVRDYDETAYTTDANEDITQVLYKRSSVTELTEVRTYNVYGHINTRVFTGDLAETWTYAYDTDNETVTGVTIA